MPKDIAGLASLFLPLPDAGQGHNGLLAGVKDDVLRIHVVFSRRQAQETLETYRALTSSEGQVLCDTAIANTSLPEESERPPLEVIGDAAEYLMRLSYVAEDLADRLARRPGPPRCLAFHTPKPGVNDGLAAFEETSGSRAYVFYSKRQARDIAGRHAEQLKRDEKTDTLAAIAVSHLPEDSDTPAVVMDSYVGSLIGWWFRANILNQYLRSTVN